MATFSRLFFFKPPPHPTHHLEGNSGVILHCSGREQSSPFMHANMGIREGGGGMEWGGGEAVGRRSRLSFQCEEVEGNLNRTCVFKS